MGGGGGGGRGADEKVILVGKGYVSTSQQKKKN